MDVDDHMPDFSAVMGMSPEKMAASHDSGTDSGAHGQIQHILTAFACAENPFGGACSVGVVVEEGFHAEFSGKVIPDGHFVPARHVEGGENDAFFKVHRRRRPDSDGTEFPSVQSGVRKEFLPRKNQLRKHFGRPPVLAVDA